MSTDDVIMVDFLDHCQDHPQPIQCRVYGRLIAQCELRLLIETWTMTDPDQEEELGDVSTFCILKSTITAARTLWTPPPSS